MERAERSVVRMIGIIMMVVAFAFWPQVGVSMLLGAMAFVLIMLS